MESTDARVEPVTRLHELLRAQRAIVGVLDLQPVLHQIVRAACDLVEAPYGALGVISPDGTALEQFIHVGVDDSTVSEIGRLPEGKGLLGALIEDPRPIRLEDLGADPRSVGFPEGHPPMRGFLGVPVRIREEVFGALYLATLVPRGFSAEDEELVTSLAATAGVAIQNARLFETASRRQSWLQASTDTTLQMLTGSPDEVFATIGHKVKELAGADTVTFVRPAPEGDTLVVEAAVGVGSQELMASAYPIENTLSQYVLDTGTPLVVDVSRDELPLQGSVFLSSVVPVGPVMVLPLIGGRTTRGVLFAGRLRGRLRFTEDEVEMATVFANHASIALELVDTRRDQQRMLLLEDRARIARDLHDHVIQQLFAAGMGIQGVAAGLDEPRAEQLEEVVGRVDEAIRQIRSSIFQLTPHRFGGHLRTAVMEVVAEVTPVLGFSPDVSFSGPVDILSDPQLTGDVAAVVREGLTNIARHASATRAQVTVSGNADRMTVCVRDDGVGLGETGRRSGLDNIRRRAEQRSGTLDIEDAAPGTQITWTASVV
ncbi:two-component system sensor histidine kinase [Nocardioides koreensis]|uniref:Two-component system sensor histidine kinase n=1 Tax=Nocardioides koreensis TaxID=433651 RepID=A0ABP5LIF7_9ACTN